MCFSIPRLQTQKKRQKVQGVLCEETTLQYNCRNVLPDDLMTFEFNGKQASLQLCAVFFHICLNDDGHFIGEQQGMCTLYDDSKEPVYNVSWKSFINSRTNIAHGIWTIRQT